MRAGGLIGAFLAPQGQLSRATQSVRHLESWKLLGGSVES